MRLYQKFATVTALALTLNACRSTPNGDDGLPMINRDNTASSEVSMVDPSRRMVIAIPQYGGVDADGEKIISGYKYVIDTPSQVPDRIIRAVQERLFAASENADDEGTGFLASLSSDELRVLLKHSATGQLADTLTRTWLVAGINGELKGDLAAKSFDNLVNRMADALVAEVEAVGGTLVVEPSYPRQYSSGELVLPSANSSGVSVVLEPTGQ